MRVRRVQGILSQGVQLCEKPRRRWVRAELRMLSEGWLGAPCSQHNATVEDHRVCLADLAIGANPMFPIGDFTCVGSLVLSNK